MRTGDQWPLCSCNQCRERREERMLEREAEFAPHEHAGDAHDRAFCVYTREDGERCMIPLRWVRAR